MVVPRSAPLPLAADAAALYGTAPVATAGVVNVTLSAIACRRSSMVLKLSVILSVKLVIAPLTSVVGTMSFIA